MAECYFTITWLADSEGNPVSAGLGLDASDSLISSPDMSPLVWPGEFLSMIGILSNTAALEGNQ